MSQLPLRTLGTAIEVSAVGYGAMGLSEFYGAADEQQALQVLQAAVDQGVTLIDTADMYGRGHNELLIGRFLRTLPPSQRQALTIATKCGIDRSATSGYNRSINNTPAYIKACCEASLRRLGVEQIDLFYIHRLNPAQPIEETMQALAELVQAGKIKHTGLCEVSTAILLRAQAVFPVDVVQTEYSLWTRHIEDEILPLLKRLHIGLVAYSPLGRGFLTGQYSSLHDFEAGDFRQSHPRFQADNMAHNKQLLDTITPLASKYQCTCGQIALAWLLAQWDGIVPIPGTKRPLYLTENINAAHIKLAAADIALLNDFKNRFTIWGERYTPEGMKGID